MRTVEQQAAAYRALRHAQRFRFVGRAGDSYIWERPLPNSSHVEQITCNVDWFWRRES